MEAEKKTDRISISSLEDDFNHIREGILDKIEIEIETEGSMADKARYMLYHLVSNKVEAIEFNIKENIPHLTGIPLKDVRIKKNILICAIIRKRQVIIPNGSDTIELDDSVIIVTKDQRFSELRDILE